MLYYAIADLHGRFDLLEKALREIRENAVYDTGSSDTYKIITLGDYIDRGPQSKEVINTLMAQQGDDFICLQGNHEAMMVQTIREPLSPEWWIGNGGDTALASYGCHLSMSRYYGMTVGYDPHAIPPEVVDWVAGLPLYYETEHHVFVHAGLPLSNEHSASSLDEQSKFKYSDGSVAMQWMLYGKNDSGWHGSKHVVHGHHQHENGPHEWSGRTDLDTYAWKTGRLVVGVYSSDKPGKAIRYLEVLGDDYEGPKSDRKRVQRAEVD